MNKYLLIAGFIFASLPALAQSTEIRWPGRNSKVICGGSVDGETLKFRVVLENELIASESTGGRLLLYVDLHKEGQVRMAMNEGATDDDYEKREAILVKLQPAEAELIRALSAARQYDLHMGMTQGFVNIQQNFGKRSITLSCQEIGLSTAQN